MTALPCLRHRPPHRAFSIVSLFGGMLEWKVVVARVARVMVVVDGEGDGSGVQVTSDISHPCHGYGFGGGHDLPTRTRTRDYP